MIIETERLLLKVISRDDIESIHKLDSYPEVEKFNTNGIPKSIEETRKSVAPFIKAQAAAPRKYYTFAIRLKASNEFIGLAGLNLSLDKFEMAELFFKISPHYWQRGYATEVSKALINLAFGQLNLHKVEANTVTENIGSVKVLEKSGMIQEGLRRKVVPIRNEWKDGYLYGILKEDLE